MSLLNLFAGCRVSNPKFSLINKNFEEINPVDKCVYYFDGCNPLVKKGDEVEIGQVMGQANSEYSTPVLSTVKGKVIEVTEKFNVEGKKVKVVVVSEIEDSSLESEKINVKGLSKQEILSKLNDLAIKDENGDSLASKLNSFNGSRIVVNKGSYEPNFKQYSILETMLDEIAEGKKIIKAISGLDIVEGTPEEGDLIIDLHTLVYIGEAFLTGMPHMYEYISVFGSAASTNKLLKVKVGTTINEIFNNLQGKEDQLFKVVAGGALNGNALFNLEVAINTTIKSLLFLNKKEGLKGKEISCIRCAKCLRACPKGLNPIKLVELWERKEFDEFIKFGGNECVECGLCSYVCPSNIEIAHTIKTAKEFRK